MKQDTQTAAFNFISDEDIKPGDLVFYETDNSFFIATNDSEDLPDVAYLNAMGEYHKVNNDFVVKACNSHYQLLEALKSIVELKHEAGRSRPYIDTILSIAKEALKNAE